MRKSIRTQAKPYIFYLPKKMDAKLEKLLEASSKTIENEIKAKQKMVEAEIEALNAESLALNATKKNEKPEIEEEGLSAVSADDIKLESSVNEASATNVDIDLDEDKLENEVRLGEYDGEAEDKVADDQAIPQPVEEMKE
jgi:hypothetical protein